MFIKYVILTKVSSVNLHFSVVHQFLLVPLYWLWNQVVTREVRPVDHHPDRTRGMDELSKIVFVYIHTSFLNPSKLMNGCSCVIHFTLEAV